MAVLCCGGAGEQVVRTRLHQVSPGSSDWRVVSSLEPDWPEQVRPAVRPGLGRGGGRGDSSGSEGGSSELTQVGYCGSVSLLLSQPPTHTYFTLVVNWSACLLFTVVLQTLLVDSVPGRCTVAATQPSHTQPFLARHDRYRLLLLTDQAVPTTKLTPKPSIC